VFHDELSRRAFVVGGGVAAGAVALELMAPASAVAVSSPERTRRASDRKRQHKAGRKHAKEVPAGLPDPAPIYARHSNPADLGILESASLLQAGLLSSREIVAACQTRIANRNGPVTFDGSPSTINAWIRLYPDLAEELASAADTRLAAARRGRSREPAPALCGVPLALKDLYAVKGLPVTASSHVLDGNVAPGDSTVWIRLRDAGMVLLGHTHTHEFALGSLTPQCGNPWSLLKSVGGSSGGSAAALAARMVPAATGSDTSGSVRSPPTANGVCGMKGTFGRISTHGVIPIGWSIDHAGVLARSAGDLGLLLSAVAGADPSDTATLANPPPPHRYPTLPRAGSKPLRDIRLGVGTDATAGIPAAVAALFDRAQDELRSLGATIVSVTEPPEASTGYSVDELGSVAVEAGIYHGQFYPAKAASYGTAARTLVSAFVAVANTLRAADYVESQQTRIEYIEQWNAVFADNQLDAILKPGASVDGVDRAAVDEQDNPEGGVTGDFAWADIAGLPVVAAPIGRSAATGLPFGIQIGGPPHGEAAILQIAIDYQAHYDYNAAVPPNLS